MNTPRSHSQRLLATLHRHASKAPRADLFSSRSSQLKRAHIQSQPSPIRSRPQFSAFHTAVTRRDEERPAAWNVGKLFNSEDRRTLPYQPAPHRNPDEPVYQLGFTCKACNHRSAHTISKQGYHMGTVLVTCPGCKNRHLIADNLHIFSDQAVNLEDLMNQKGEEMQKATVGPGGEIEFWKTRGERLERAKEKAQDSNS